MGSVFGLQTPSWARLGLTWSPGNTTGGRPDTSSNLTSQHRAFDFLRCTQYQTKPKVFSRRLIRQQVVVRRVYWQGAVHHHLELTCIVSLHYLHQISKWRSLPSPTAVAITGDGTPKISPKKYASAVPGTKLPIFTPTGQLEPPGSGGHALYHQAIAITGRWPCRRESMARVWWLGWGRAGLAFTPTHSSTFSEKMARAGGFHTRAPSGMRDSQSRSHNHSPKTSPRRWESSSTGGREVWRSSRTTISWARPLRTSTKATTSSFPSCARRRLGRRWRWSRCDEASPRSSTDVGMRSRRACLRRSVFTRCRCPTFSRTSFWIPCEQG